MTEGPGKRPAGSADRRRLADSLRALRLNAGISTTALANQLGWSQSKVSKIETGRTRPAPADVRIWAQHLRAPSTDVDDLVEQAIRAASQVATWRTVHAAGLARRQREVGVVEAGIVSLLNFQPAIIPGLLQTPEYARHVLAMSDVSDRGDISAAVAARLNRQAVLFDEAKTFRFVLTEAALRWRPGPTALLHAQLDRLLTLMSQPNVTISVIPLDVEAALPYLSGFTIFESPDDAVVLVELLATELLLSQPDELDLYRSAFERLAASSLGDRKAQALIRGIIR